MLAENRLHVHQIHNISVVTQCWMQIWTCRWSVHLLSMDINFSKWRPVLLGAVDSGARAWTASLIDFAIINNQSERQVVLMIGYWPCRRRASRGHPLRLYKHKCHGPDSGTHLLDLALRRCVTCFQVPQFSIYDFNISSHIFTGARDEYLSGSVKYFQSDMLCIR